VQEHAASIFKIEEYAAQGSHSTVQGELLRTWLCEWETRTSEGGGAKTAKEKAGKNKCNEERTSEGGGAKTAKEKAGKNKCNEERTSEGGGAKTAKEKAGKNKCDEEEKERKILRPAYLFSTTSSLAMLPLSSLCLPLTHSGMSFPPL